jgi:hypothetical protein
MILSWKLLRRAALGILFPRMFPRHAKRPCALSKQGDEGVLSRVAAMYQTEPDILPMLGDRRRHPIAVKAKQRERTVDEDSAAGGCDGVQRIVYIAPLDVLVTCERERGASIWETHARMRLLARLPHGRNAIHASLIQGTSPRMSAEHRVRIGATSAAGSTSGGKGLLDVCATVLDCVHVPGAPSPDGGKSAQQAHSALGTARDGAGRLHDARIVTSGMDRHLCAWAERPPHGLCNALRAPCAQLCLVWHAAHGALLFGFGLGLAIPLPSPSPSPSPSPNPNPSPNQARCCRAVPTARCACGTRDGRAPP